MNRILAYFSIALLSAGIASCKKPCPKYKIVQDMKHDKSARQFDIPLENHKTLHLVLLNKHDSTTHVGKIEYSGEELEITDADDQPVCILFSESKKSCGIMSEFSQSQCKGSNDGMSFVIAEAKLQ